MTFIILGTPACHLSPCLYYLVNMDAQFEGSGPTVHPMLSIRSLARGLQVEWGELAYWLLRTRVLCIDGQIGRKCSKR